MDVIDLIEMERQEFVDRECRLDLIQLLQEEVEHLLWSLETLPERHTYVTCDSIPEPC
jgi:hypothetical protein